MTDISFRKIECRSASGGLVQSNFTKELTRSRANECGVSLLQLRAAGPLTVQSQNAPIPVAAQASIGLRVENERFPDFAHSFFSFWLLREAP